MKTADISVELIDSCGTDLNVVNAARVSFEKESGWGYIDEETGELLTPLWDGHELSFMDNVTYKRHLLAQDTKLINYLAKHKHFSPFNHCFMSFRVKAPIFVARQLVKHKFMPWNEVSRRYVDSEPEFYIPTKWRKRAENVKQGSSDEGVDLNIRAGWNCSEGLMETPYEYADYALSFYKELLRQGVCPEQARMVLPQNTMTEWIWSGTLGAVADMCKLRLDSHTQYETRLVAEKVAAFAEDAFPVSFKALLNNYKE